MPELEQAIDRLIAGPESRTRVIGERERTRTAYHESGHAVTMRYLEQHPPLHRVSIVPHGRMAGYTRCLQPLDELFVSRGRLKAMLAAALAGHAAEHVVLGDVASGADDDIRRATDIARRMITRYGMSERLGPVALGPVPAQVSHARETANEQTCSDHTTEAIDREIHATGHQCGRRSAGDRHSTCADGTADCDSRCPNGAGPWQLRAWAL
jgi:cell division protease FtsH